MSTTVELDKAKREIAALKRDLEVSEQQLGAACAEAERLTALLAVLGFCPKDGDSMPCFTCGAGL